MKNNKNHVKTYSKEFVKNKCYYKINFIFNKKLISSKKIKYNI